MEPTVMVVDDSAMTRIMIRRTLSEVGYNVVGASDGQDALDKLDEGVSPELILCDVNMPRVNGMEFLQDVRSREAFAHVPIVMLTTEAGPDLIAQARGLKARGWIIKPFKPEAIVAMTQKLVPKAA